MKIQSSPSNSPIPIFFLEKTFLIKTGDRCTTDFEFENKRYGFECQRYGIKTSNKKDVYTYRK